MEMVDILLGLSWFLSLLFAFASGSLSGSIAVAKRQKDLVSEIFSGAKDLFKKDIKEEVKENE